MAAELALSQEVRSVLERSSIEGTIVRLPEQLERQLYVSVDKALKAIGGKWDRKVGGHVFPFDVSTMLSGAVETGVVVDRQKALQFFETPTALAQRMVELADIQAGDLVLEPSAGHGRIVREIRADALVLAVEIDGVNIDTLRSRATANVTVIQADFLEWAKPVGDCFDVVLMNPPFTNGQDIAHIRAAHELLVEDGVLVAVCSAGPFFRQDKKAVAFREWLSKVGYSEPLPDGAFAESGTGVRAHLVVTRHRQ
jgi:predicted RNA methylase